MLRVFNHTLEGAPLASLLMFGALYLMSACSTGGSPEVGVVRSTVGDTLVVVNTPPEGPAPVAFHLVEDLVLGTLGEGEDDPYALTAISGLAVDREDRILVSSHRDAEVRVFDDAGSFVTRFGRPGGGPGEFGSGSMIPPSLFLMPLDDGRIAVAASREIEVFESDGRYSEGLSPRLLSVSEVPVGTITRAIAWFSNLDRLVFPWSGPEWVDGREVRQLLITDSKLKLLRRLPPILAPMGYAGRVNFMVRIPYGASLYFAATGDRYVVWGGGDVYSLMRYDVAEDRWLRFTLERAPDPISSGEMARAVAERIEGLEDPSGAQLASMLRAAEKPDHRPFFLDLMGDDRSRVWVRQYPSAGAEGPLVYDVFDSEGVWRGVVSSPVSLRFVRGDHAYYAGRHDPEEYPIVVRCRLVPGPDED